MPMIVYGDFNMLHNEVGAQGWYDRMNATVVKCNRPTTLKTAQDRHIDFFVISDSLIPIVENIQPVLDVPWGPHIGLSITLTASPRSICGKVMCIPKPLPLLEFKNKWGEMEEGDKQQHVARAKEEASRILNKQKAKTGVATLGTPLPALKRDPKYQNKLLNSSIQVGEQ